MFPQPLTLSVIEYRDGKFGSCVTDDDDIRYVMDAMCGGPTATDVIRINKSTWDVYATPDAPVATTTPAVRRTPVADRTT